MKLKTMSSTSISPPVLNCALGKLKKYQVLHIVKDNKVGGVKSNLNGFVKSDLAAEFEFTVLNQESDRITLKNWQLQPDVIVWHPPCRLKSLPSLLLLKLLNPHTKIIIHEHGYSQGYEPFNVSSTSRFHFMLKLFYALADKVVAISESQKQWMLQNRLVAPEKLAVIRQCPPLDKFFAVTPKAPSNPLKLAAYGRFCAQKGFDVLLKALKLIPNTPVQLYLGGEGVMEAQLKQLAQELDNVEFVGRVDDVPSFLQNCDVVVIPSRWEPWGNVCLEAKAAGKSAIASDVDGLTEQMPGCGLLVPPNDPEKLAQAIVDIVQLPPSQLAAWGNNGRNLVTGDNGQYIERWQTLLKEIVASST